MGHRANYVIVENGQASAFQDPWGALGCTFVLADGPGECKNLAQSAEPTTVLMSWAEAEAGFLLDFDKRRCIAFGTPQLDQTEELPPEVVAQVTSVMTALEQGPAVMFEQFARHWPGWTMVWDPRGVDAFGEYLGERGITSVEVPPPGGSEGVIGEPIEVAIPSAAIQAALALAEGSAPRPLPIAPQQPTTKAPPKQKPVAKAKKAAPTKKAATTKKAAPKKKKAAAKKKAAPKKKKAPPTKKAPKKKAAAKKKRR